jgi:hypothetical protein
LLNTNQLSCFPFATVTQRLLALFSPWQNMAVFNKPNYKPFLIVIAVHQTSLNLAQDQRIA